MAQDENLVIEEASVSSEVASQWKLMWWKFRRHKLAMAGAVMTILIYLVALFADFLAPFASDRYIARYTYAPPQRLKFIVHTDEGRKFQPHVNGYRTEVDPVALRRTYPGREQDHTRWFLRQRTSI